MSTLAHPLRQVLVLFLALTTRLVAAQTEVLFQSYPSTVVEGNTYPIVWGTDGLDGSNADTVRTKPLTKTTDLTGSDRAHQPHERPVELPLKSQPTRPM